MSLGQQIIPASGEDIDVLARTVFGEARGETLAGQIAVAFTVLHRSRLARGFKEVHGVDHRFFGDGSIASACKAAKQYSCWNEGSPTLKTMADVTMGNASFQMAHYVATGVVNQALSDALPNATHYYNPQGVLRIPVWVTGRPAAQGRPAIKPGRFDGTIGHHRFYSQVG